MTISMLTLQKNPYVVLNRLIPEPGDISKWSYSIAGRRVAVLFRKKTKDFPKIRGHQEYSKEYWICICNDDDKFIFETRKEVTDALAIKYQHLIAVKTKLKGM